MLTSHRNTHNTPEAMTQAISWTNEDEKLDALIDKYADRIAANVRRLMSESLACRVPRRLARRGCKIPFWLIECHSEWLDSSAAKQLPGIYPPGDYEWTALPPSPLWDAAQAHRDAVKPIVDQAFSGDWNGLKESTLRARIRRAHGRKIEDCDWEAYLAYVIEENYPGVLWQGRWYTEEGLAQAQAKAGIELIKGDRSDCHSAVLAPYEEMTEIEAECYLEWAWGQRDASGDNDLIAGSDAELDARLLDLGQVWMTSGRRPEELLYSFCHCREQMPNCWMVPSSWSDWIKAIRLDRVWSTLPGYSSDLADI